MRGWVPRDLMIAVRSMWLISTLVITLSCCPNNRNSSQSAPAPLKASLLSTADPVHDLALSVKAGDLRFVGVKNMGEFIPGGEDQGTLTAKFGVKYVEGSDDTDPKPDVDAAFEYAQIYNRLLIRHIRSREMAK